MSTDRASSEPQPQPQAPAGKPRRFRVALTFPGEIREVVKPIADALAVRYGRERILYDSYHTAEFSQPDLSDHLPDLYPDESDLIVVFLCPEYATKEWCQLEWSRVRTLRSTVDKTRIMFLSFGDPGELSQIGISRKDGFQDIHGWSADDVAELIQCRLDSRIFTRRRRPAIRRRLVAGIALAVVGVGWALIASNVVCMTLSRLGRCPPWCESTLTAADVAGLHRSRLTFKVPPALADTGATLVPQTWLVMNRSGRSVGLMYGPLVGSAGETGGPRSWDLNPNVPPLTRDSRPVELSTGELPGGSTGAWVVAAFDAADPSRLLSATVVRLVFQDDGEKERLFPQDSGAKTLEIRSAGESYAIVQMPKLPLTPWRITTP